MTNDHALRAAEVIWEKERLMKGTLSVQERTSLIRTAIDAATEWHKEVNKALLESQEKAIRELASERQLYADLVEAAKRYRSQVRQSGMVCTAQVAFDAALAKVEGKC